MHFVRFAMLIASLCVTMLEIVNKILHKYSIVHAFNGSRSISTLNFMALLFVVVI